MWKSRLLFGAALTSLWTNSLASEASTRAATVSRERFPESAVYRDDDSQFALTWENDAFGSGKDNNYTNGLKLTYFAPDDAPDAPAQWLEAVMPVLEINETTRTYYSFGQNLYTPDDISIETPQPNERPWAGFLYAAMGLTSASRNHVDEAEVMVGAVGPWSLGRETQELMHEALGVRQPRGWDHQLDNEVALNLSWTRRWPFAWSHTSGGRRWSVEPNVGLALGNVYTHASAGVVFRMAPSEAPWHDTPVRVYPARPGTGLFQEQDFSWHFFSGIQLRAVARNIFLDGNTFGSGPSAERESGVAAVNLGIAVSVGEMSFSYTLVYGTKEYKTQNDDSLIGVLNVGQRF